MSAASWEALEQPSGKPSMSRQGRERAQRKNRERWETWGKGEGLGRRERVEEKRGEYERE